MKLAAVNATRDNLNSIMEFDHLILVKQGRVHSTWLLHAPELHDGELDQLPGGPWRLMNGWSGQYLYSGPIMHQSEFIGGAMADHILENDGYYIALVDYPDEGEPEGWAVAYCPLEAYPMERQP